MDLNLFKELINKELITSVGDVQKYLNDPSLLSSITIETLLSQGLITEIGVQRFFKEIVGDEAPVVETLDSEPASEEDNTSMSIVLEEETKENTIIPEEENLPETEIVVEEESEIEVEPEIEPESEGTEYGEAESEDLEVSDVDALPTSEENLN